MSDDSLPTPPHSSDLSDTPTGQVRGPAGLGIEVAGLTDKGRVRPGNEDNLTYQEPDSPQARAHGTLLVVSDGMGGHAAGEVASQIAVEMVQATYYRQRGMPVSEAIRESIIAANSAIYEAAQRNMERAGMGCTIVVLVVQGADLTIGHVGDSRAYLIRGGRAIQLTRDHSWVAMQVQEGILTPEQAEHHPNRSVLMRALGRQPSVEVDLSHRHLQTGDLLLLCSDGLTGMVTDAEIAEYASRVQTHQLPRQLVDLANQRGAPDNVTVLVGAITGTPTPAQAVSGAATTIVSAPADARTTRAEQPIGESPTDRNLRRPSSATAPLAQPARPPGSPPGTPVVVSRTSVTERDVNGSNGRGKGKWIAGAVAAFGLAAALLLLSVSQLTRENGPPSPATVGTATPATAGAPAPPQPVATIPPPISTTLPGIPVAPQPGQATPPPTTAPAAVPTAAGGAATATRPAPAASPAVGATAATTPLIPATPTLQSTIATATPTAASGGSSGETPATSSETPSTAPAGTAPERPPGDTAGAAPATADPSAEEPAPDDPPPPGPAVKPQPKPGFQIPGGFGVPPARKRDDD